MSNRLAYLRGNPAADPSSSSPSPSPGSSRKLRETLNRGLEEALNSIPPQYRVMARSLLPQLRGYLSKVSDAQLREGLLKVRGVIDQLLQESGGE